MGDHSGTTDRARFLEKESGLMSTLQLLLFFSTLVRDSSELEYGFPTMRADLWVTMLGTYDIDLYKFCSDKWQHDLDDPEGTKGQWADYFNKMEIQDSIG